MEEACTDDWIVECATPNIAKVFGRQLAIVFGKALLWLAFSEKANDAMPVATSAWIKSACGSPNQTIPDGQIPVCCRLVVTTREEATVHMEDVIDDNKDGFNKVQQPTAAAEPSTGTQNVQR